VYEIIYVECGQYAVGYNYNFKGVEVKLFGRGTAIGDWEIFFNHVSEYNY